MEYFKGEDRILYIRVNGIWLPIGCLTDNSMEESSEFIDTTTRDNGGWATSRPTMQSYSISFSGLQLNTTVAGGNFSVASYDKLKIIKRGNILLDWKIEGHIYPIVDYGKGYIQSLSEVNAIDELMTFTGTIIGYGPALTRELNINLLNTGNPNELLNDGNENELIRTNDI